MDTSIYTRGETVLQEMPIDPLTDFVITTKRLYRVRKDGVWIEVHSRRALTGYCYSAHSTFWLGVILLVIGVVGGSIGFSQALGDGVKIGVGVATFILMIAGLLLLKSWETLAISVGSQTLGLKKVSWFRARPGGILRDALKNVAVVDDG